MKKSILSTLIVLLLLACNAEKKKTVPVGMDAGKDTMVADVTEDVKINPLIRDSSSKMLSKLTRVLANDSVLADGRKPTSWEVAGIRNVPRLKQFILELQRFVASNNKMEVGNCIKYPLKKTIRNYKDFYRNYNILFTPDVKNALAKTNVKQLYRNEHGVMIGNAKMWIAQEGNQFKIITINN